MKTYKTYLCPTCDGDQTDEVIERWHRGELRHATLHQALGWTWQEYCRWLESRQMPTKRIQGK